MLYKKHGDNRRKSNKHQINNTSNSKTLSYVSRIDAVNISNNKKLLAKTSSLMCYQAMVQKPSHSIKSDSYL